LSEEKINLFKDTILFRNIAKVTLILSEEEDSNLIFIIHDGLVKVTKFSDHGREIILEFLGKDEFFW